MIVLGVDGCRAGWLALRFDTERRSIDPLQTEHWRDLPWRQCERVAVDMPIGLADIGPRDCDIAARQILPKGRKSSVFAPPRRYMLSCDSWSAAHRLGLEREGSGISKQAWNITAKIRELDAELVPADQSRVVEAHPELVFHHLGGGKPLPPKRERQGQTARLDLLRTAGLPELTPLLDLLPRNVAGPDDVIDAAACMYAALRPADGAARRVPSHPPLDRRGLRMEIWY